MSVSSRMKLRTMEMPAMLKSLPVAAAVILAVTSCNRVPSYVIEPDEMASLMADMHIAESVVDVNRRDYPSDSMLSVMKQSVLARHGVTQAQLDTSFDWYGHNINRYMEVYDKTIELLERRIAETGNRIAAEAVSVAGDSVDVWSNSPFLGVNDLSPSKIITFSLNRDENWEPGDSYTWRAKFVNSTETSVWSIVADYGDGSKEILSTELSGDGWHEIKFATDSTRIIEGIYGYMSLQPRPHTTLWADSIMLIRNRLDAETYNQRYRQRMVTPLNRRQEKIKNDSTSVNADSIAVVG